MKAVIMDAEWKPGKRFAPLTRQHPMCVVPVLNEPIVQHTIDLLYRKGITDVIISFSDHSGTKELESIVERNKGRSKIQLYKETIPRGTAGILKNVMPLIGNEPFLLIYSNLYIEDINLKDLMNFHDRKGAIVTVGVKRRTKKEANIETINMSREGMLKDLHIIHHSVDRRSPWVSSGIYVLAPEVFNFIDDQKYFDIKEQLLPLLQKSSRPVYAYEVDDYHRYIYGVEDYLALHRDLFDINSRAIQFENKVQIAEGVWVGRDTVISPRSYLVSPVVLGNKCHIADHAQIIGPAVIGDGCKIGESAFVRESILWRNVTLEPRARCECCILAEGLKIPEGKRFRNFVVADSLQEDEMNSMLLDYNRIRVGESNLSQILSVDIKNWTYRFIKRVMDISIALLLLLLSSPLFIIIALAIKMSSESPGPVFYIQKRCGKNGKTFKMFKFRTMVTSAEKMQGELLSQNNVDGPMFKMENDPRITRLGKILRETSLDELPQLINVLRGEMSLVGPRPLVMEEMKFSPSWRDVRLSVKPGITGMWQIQGRSEAPFYNWIRYDVEYVMKQSLWTDIVILFKTIKVVFKKLGAY
jgi:lipopolysaccharide/colanic/teichoic acid biosynthesis glycosyltransferase/ADP-glucose pyrophosphorylase